MIRMERGQVVITATRGPDPHLSLRIGERMVHGVSRAEARALVALLTAVLLDIADGDTMPLPAQT